MKLTNLKLSVLAASLFSLAALTTTSYGTIVYGDGVLSTTDPTFHHPNASTVGTAVQYYDVYAFTVDTTGAYTFELGSLNTTGTPSNALDTFEAIYANVFNPVSPGAGIAFNDDFTGSFTILPGPYSGIGLTATATGFSGNEPGSRNAAVNLTAGTAYFYVVTSFRSTDFVGTGTTAQPKGNYYFGISGPGNIIVVPEPSTFALLGVMGAGALGLRVWRKRKTA